ncbi:hypothetical protein BGZ80_002806 [Entomortierella chlamydospora]|uniref:Uncharacterized protein n=1 Tax=Entomortierella chlamydospora TaxID=101097 RepID=A0A9P6N2J2_9FUNG|nr:hypothetical protein BGZ80_002806 [Entomortierella chlamydospora]
METHPGDCLLALPSAGSELTGSRSYMEKAIKDINSDGKRAWTKETSKWLEAQHVARERDLPAPSPEARLGSEPAFSKVKEHIKTSTSITRYMVGRFVGAIDELGRTEIWNRRCELTVEWERENDIFPMRKRAKGHTCVGGLRRSRSDFIARSSHRPRLATDARDTRKEADERLVQSYLRQLDLNVMER